MTYPVIFSPEASADLIGIYRHIEQAASPAIAKRFTDAIVAHCESLRELPERAVRRDDIRPGLHVTNYRGRVVIAFGFNGAQVSIVGVYYGGRDFETLLQADLDE